MNLIKDPWISAKRADGSICIIAPWEIGESDNPIVEITAPRPDFKGALYQFLIGIVQTAFAPTDDDEWKEKWDKVPSCEDLKAAFEKFVDAFELLNENGPAFMQDFDLPAEAEEVDIRGLLIDSPGESTLKKNCDHFVKRNMIERLCENCVASALISLQANAPSGGAGHRTGMRGGGPLTTLVIPTVNNSTIWNTIWLNVLARDERFKMPQHTVDKIFPWIKPTRESSDDKKTFPEDVDELQLYWGTPRRIRLFNSSMRGVCDVCGCERQIWTSYKARKHGVSYSSTWIHALSPYRRQQEKDGSNSLIAIKGKQGGISYPDWLSLTLGNGENTLAASVVRSFFEHKFFKIENSAPTRLWCFGYDMDNMAARCWYDQTMPLLALAKDKHAFFVDELQKMIVAAQDASKYLRDQVKAAWFAKPKDVKGDTSFIVSSFWEETEAQFFVIASNVHRAIEAEESRAPLLSEWRICIIDSAERIFDRLALQATDEVRNMKRIAMAAKELTNILNSPKTKNIEALKEIT